MVKMKASVCVSCFNDPQSRADWLVALGLPGIQFGPVYNVTGSVPCEIGLIGQLQDLSWNIINMLSEMRMGMLIWKYTWMII